MLKALVVAGPTGSGKSALALRIAEATGGEIVNFDSVQIYRGFDIGSAKPSPEVRKRVPHHLFDIADASEEFHAASFARVGRDVCAEIAARGKMPILTGGTFFYLRALLSGLPEMPGSNDSVRRRLGAIAARPRGSQRLHAWLSRVDPITAGRVVPADRHRVERALEVWVTAGRPISSWNRPSPDATSGIQALKLAIQTERPLLVERLDRRVDEMYAAGLIEETRALLSRHPRHARPFDTIGYREAAGVVEGSMDLEAAILETKRRTRAYAKRQVTWLRSERNVQWLPPADSERTFAAAMRLIERFQLE